MSNKQLTTKQEAFLDNLVKVGGDPKQAAELAGYSEGSYSSVVKSLKTEILDLATNILAQSAPKAAFKLVDIMDSSEPVPQANIRIQAAQQILDRVGLGKTDRLDVTVNTQALQLSPHPDVKSNVLMSDLGPTRHRLSNAPSPVSARRTIIVKF